MAGVLWDGRETGGGSGGTQGSEPALHVPLQAPSSARPSSASITSPQTFWTSSEASSNWTWRKSFRRASPATISAPAPQCGTRHPCRAPGSLAACEHVVGTPTGGLGKCMPLGTGPAAQGLPRAPQILQWCRGIPGPAKIRVERFQGPHPLQFLQQFHFDVLSTFIYVCFWLSIHPINLSGLNFNFFKFLLYTGEW